MPRRVPFLAVIVVLWCQSAFAQMDIMGVWRPLPRNQDGSGMTGDIAGVPVSLVPDGNALPGGSSRPSGTRRHVRDTQSSDGDATTTSLAAGFALPRSQTRPTGSPPQAARIAITKMRRMIRLVPRAPRIR